MKKKLIAACGNDCALCPRKNAQTNEELNKVAELWLSVGYRDTIVTPEEIACSGCKPTNACRYGIASCVAEKHLSDCAECELFPCEKFAECLRTTLTFRESVEKNASFEEAKTLKAAFFEKRENLERLKNKRSSFFSKLKRRLIARAKDMKTDIPAVYLCLKHKSTPLAAKLSALICIIYALSPIDLIPDFIPVLGYLDDLIILPALIALTVKLVPKEVFASCQAAAKEQNGALGKKWYFALPFVLVWAALLIFIVKALF